MAPGARDGGDSRNAMGRVREKGKVTFVRSLVMCVRVYACVSAHYV